MDNLDIKKMLVQHLMGEMSSNVGNKLKKKPAAIVIEKHSAEVPMDEENSEPSMDEPSMDDESDEKPGLAAIREHMGIKKRGK